MTPASRLRLLLARVVGERRMLAVARWACPGDWQPAPNGVYEALTGMFDDAVECRDEERRKRRALARRRWARRRSPRTLFGSRLCMWISADPSDWAKGAGRIHLSEDPICQPGAEYGPSGAADLGYVNKSQSTNKETL